MKTMNNPKIENWSMINDPVNDMYTAPECRSYIICGNVYNHKSYEDGKFIRTSAIVNVNGRIVETYSGSIYELGKPDEDYLKFLKEINYEYNEENPINVKVIK